MPEDSGLCTTCFYFKSKRGADWFWSRKGDYLFPYNIGHRSQFENLWDRNPLDDPKVNWRAYMKTQPLWPH